MFHWICPECGREIAPQAQECPACEPAATPLEPVDVLAEAAPQPAPEPVVASEPSPALLSAAESVALVMASSQPQDPGPGVAQAIPPPAAAVPTRVAPVTSEVAPLEPREALMPAAPLDPSRPLDPAPRAASGVRHAPLCAPQAARPVNSAPAAAILVQPAPAQPALAEAVAAQFPPLVTPGPAEPRAAGICDYESLARARMQAARGPSPAARPEVKEAISLPGPTLAHELTSLEAAGLARVLVLQPAEEAPRHAGWFLSIVVASGMLALALSAVFYVLPSAATPAASVPPPPQPSPQPAAFTPETPRAPEHPQAAAVEVTGIRFITDLPNRPPQIHYLVVNHGPAPLAGLVVTVVLRAADTATGQPLSQFSFRAPALGPYESKEMVSSIERVSRPVDIPHWRNLRAEVRIEP